MEDRYSRQQLFSPIGEKGQELIRKKHVLLVGVGALGCVSAEAVVRAGIGTITLIDRDYVEWSNLQRQQLFCERDAQLKLPKVIAAKKRLTQINSDVNIHAHMMDAGAVNMEPLLKGVDVIIDATDNFDSRFILNDLSQKFNIPWIYGSCVGSFGLCYTIIPQQSPCLQCVLKQHPLVNATCDTAGVIGPIVQMIASYQVAETLKILVEDFSALNKALIAIDLWNNQHYSMNMNKSKDEACPSCGNQPTYPSLNYDSQTKTAVLCGRNTVQIRHAHHQYFDLEKLERKLLLQGTVQRNPYLVSCQFNECRVVFFQDGRVFVHGTDDILTAKNIFYQILG
ncbi:MAG: MoeB/ThiF family adenylyltransferase [Bacillus sp. (in: firmicutes)]